jgi:cell division septation protein DedD
MDVAFALLQLEYLEPAGSRSELKSSFIASQDLFQPRTFQAKFMPSEMPQTPASDEKEVALPILISPEESPDEDEPGHQDGSHTAQEPGFSESAESAGTLHGPTEATGADHKNRTGMRVLRTSPVALVACGLVLLSLIFLLDFMARTGTTSASNQAANNRAPADVVEEKKETAPAAAPENVARTSEAAPQPVPSVETSAVAAPTGEVASVVHKEDREPEQQASALAPSPSPMTNVEAPGDLSPATATPRGEDGFTLQIGSFNELAQAQERVDKLGSVGVTAYVARVEIPKRGTWYRVQTGHFSSREEAMRYGTQLRSKGAVADFVVTTSKAT